MAILDQIHNRYFATGFVINSLPKSGTHLLAKAIDLMPGVASANLHLGQASADKLHAGMAPKPEANQETIPIGVDWPQPAAAPVLRRALRQVGRGRYATAHVPYSIELAAMLRQLELKTLLMLRDPRDVVVSHAGHVARTERHFLSTYYQSLSPAEQIMTSIVGYQAPDKDGPQLLTIRERCQSLLNWNAESTNLTVTFEALVGAQGGGSRSNQMETLRQIAVHLGLWCDDAGRQYVIANLFGGTNTFDKGVIGRWRTAFSPAHRQAFKETAGDLLIDLGYEQDYDW